MGRRQAPEVNAGSMADIAFLLLIFFLVTSEMSKEAGMFQLLPEKTTDSTPPKKINERNIINVLARENNELMFGGESVSLNQIKVLIKERILNEGNNSNWPENKVADLNKIKERIAINRKNLEETTIEKQVSSERKLRKAQLRLKAFELFGNDFKTSEHVINLQATQGADYQTYISLKDELKQAYTELRSELAKKKLGRSWNDLNLEEKGMLKMVYKENISEAPVVQ